jgi:hypothetical protein
MAAHPPRALYDAVNGIEAGTLAEMLGIARARERGKFACVACPSSDGLHAYRGGGRGFYCFACGTAFSAVDAAMAVWGLEHGDACQRLADAFGLTASTSEPRGGTSHVGCLRPFDRRPLALPCERPRIKLRQPFLDPIMPALCDSAT